ncbi:MAG: hypothetical protein J4G01_10020, partial [Dehalococcoidia bacterium]|nr:hypothetical protein [Dehalococcoidia bacterium]
MTTSDNTRPVPEHIHRDEDMLSVEDAYNRIMAFFGPLEAQDTPLLQAQGQVLAEDITSPFPLPPLDNSAMDGYALRHGDILGAGPDTGKDLRVIAHVAAGHVPDTAVTPGTAIRIMTGAPIPEGADTIVPFEETDEVQRKRSGQSL